jgi:hypothetical protein
LDVNGNVTHSGVKTTVSGYLLRSVAGGIAAAGSNQGTATALSKDINPVTSSTVNSADGVSLPAFGGMQMIVLNLSAANIKVYPSTGGQIDSLGTNVPYVLGPDARLMFVSISATQWYSMSGVYA